MVKYTAVEVIKDLVAMMEMQEKRERGEFHISSLAFFPMWNEAKLRGKEYLWNEEHKDV